MLGIRNNKKAHTLGEKLGHAVHAMGHKLFDAPGVVPKILTSGLNLIEAHSSNSSATSQLPMGLKHKGNVNKKSNLEKK